MLDFLKALIDKLRVNLLLASLAVAILLYKLCGFDIWWMVFVFCVTYIVILGIELLFKDIRKGKEVKRKHIAKVLEAKQEEAYLNEEIWKRFYALDNQTLDFVRTIYYAERDPNNPLIRYIQDGGNVAYLVEQNYIFRIPKGDRGYSLLLYAEHLTNNSVITFQPYFLKLVAQYVKTGKKEREINTH